MAWVWYATSDTSFEPAEFDFSSPMQPYEALSRTPLDTSKGVPIFRTRTKIEKFDALHCPPVDDGPPVVDDVWQKIILDYVPRNLIQFYPITLIGKGGSSRKFSWVIPFSFVRCIDLQRSNVIIKEEKPDITHIVFCDYYVHRDNCLGSVHLARDEQDPTHIVLSNKLRDALAATGEYSMFYQPEDLPTIGSPVLH